MIFYGLFFIIVGILIILYPDLLSYLVGFFIIFLGLNLFVWGIIFKKAEKDIKEEVFVELGPYKIVKFKK